ncbi:MAG: dihydropteroate synthase [bacterium]|nr:dihydropteroate synthase [bacterium]
MALRVCRYESINEARDALHNLGVDPVGIACMTPKMRHRCVLIRKVEPKAANIIKQDMLSLGADAAVARGTVECSIPYTDVILMGTLKQLRLATEKFKRQPFGIKKIASDLSAALSFEEKERFEIKYRGGSLVLGEKTQIMGILNTTPDSFSDGGRFLDPEVAIERAVQMADEGAHIIDIGGESTRPGSSPVSLDEELKRVIPVIKKLAKNLDIPISIDSSKAEVAKRALDVGAAIVNDISALRADDQMAGLVAKAGCPVILMHMQGAPGNMQKNPVYASLIDEIIAFFEENINIATRAGIDSDNIIIDPGIGFGKRLSDNLQIINRVDEFKALGKPLLIGPSRKSFIGEMLGDKEEDRLEGTLAASVLSMARGVQIIRVHDVKEAVRAAKISDAILKSS